MSDEIDRRQNGKDCRADRNPRQQSLRRSRPPCPGEHGHASIILRPAPIGFSQACSIGSKDRRYGFPLIQGCGARFGRFPTLH